jgi:membrane fusion protein (multidrug efflux system)
VETRQAIADKWLVASGLHAGDRLLIQGLNKVRVGDTVRPVEVEDDAAGKVAANRGPTER